MSENQELDRNAKGNILTLLDDEGVEHEFEIVDETTVDDQVYFALVTVLQQPEEIINDRGQLVILKLVEEDGEEFLDSIEDEDEFNRIGEIFMNRLENTFDFED